jgi:MFS family permease
MGMSADQAYEHQVRSNYKYNFTVNLLDGTFFWFGNSFIASGVILPLYVSYFTDSPILIGLIAVLSSAGFFIPQLFTANWVEQAPLKKFFPVKIGLFTERLPIVLLAPTAALLALTRPNLALISFFILLAWHTLGAGLIAVGWQDMLAKVIPVERRGRFMGLTNFLGTGTGILGAGAAAWFLGNYPFPGGYIACFAIAGLTIMISWFFLSLTREPPLTHRTRNVSYKEYWSNLPAVLKNDRNFSKYLIAQAVINLGSMAWGFLAVYSVQNWGLADYQVGLFTTAMLVGQTAANLLFGMLADRFGYKLVIELGALAAVLAVLLALIAPNPGWFYMVFALRGVQFSSLLIAMLFAFEFSGPDIRPTYIGLSNTASGISSGIAPLMGGLLASGFGYNALFLAALVISLLGWLVLRFWVRDPRWIKKSEAVVGVLEMDTGREAGG